MAFLGRLRSRCHLSVVGGRYLRALGKKTRYLTCEASLKPSDQIPIFSGAAQSIEDFYTSSKFVYPVRGMKHSHEKLFKKKPASITAPTVLLAYDPNDVKTVFSADGKLPERLDLVGLKHVNDHLGIGGTIQTCQGEEWWRHRQPISQFMMKPRKVAEYQEGFNSVTHDLMKAIYQLRDPQTSILSDVPRHFTKWSFESVALFTLGKRMGALLVTNDPPEFLRAVYGVFHTTHQDYDGHLKAHEKMYSEGMKLFEKKMEEVNALSEELRCGRREIPEKVDFVTSMLLSGKMNPNDLSVDTVDLLFAGTDTTAYTLTWTLYNLATHPEVQEKLRSEVLRVVGREKEMVTTTHISNMPYLRSCVKETLRLCPTGPQITAVLHKDVALSGYFVPKGTIVSIPMYLLGTDSDNFPERTLEYFPERWDRTRGSRLSHAFAHVPFGFGSRMCVGRRVAELELHIALAHLMRNFRMEYPDDIPLGYDILHTHLPDRRMDLKMMDY